MIITTRYRDIPWEEIQRMEHHRIYWKEALWNKTRGTPILIRIPADNAPVISGCTQPRYKVVDANNNPRHHAKTGLEISVCSHIAEIGD